MLLAYSHSGEHTGHSFCLQLSAAAKRGTFILFVIALLLITNGKAQEQARQVNILIQQLQSSDNNIRRSAAEAISKIGPAGQEAIPALIFALDDPDKAVRALAVNALGEMGASAKDAIPMLIQGLKDTHKFDRSGIAFALGLIGPQAKAAVPAILSAMSNPEVTLPFPVTGEKDAWPKFLAAKKASNTVLPGVAINTIMNIGPVAIPALLSALKDTNSFTRAIAADILGRFGPEAREAILS